MDFKRDRIYNGWILFGILAGLFFQMQEGGWYGVCNAVIPMLIPFVLLYPIYKIGALGAGDIKLFMASGSFLTTEQFVHVIIVSFIIAALFSLMKMISERNAKERMRYLLSYLLEMCKTREWNLYEETCIQNTHAYKSNKIHFALPICISVMLELGGLF
ncbi:MAG: prepilin peptidase [Lachnospiraceae bacterium]|nr:prepilin peptidase [Lachnospiraceae bacterium]